MKRIIATTIFLSLAILLAMYVDNGNTSSSAATALSAHQIAERTKPGIVMIETVWKAQIVVPEPDFDESKAQLLLRRVRQQIAEGIYPNTQQGVAAATVRESLVNFLDYVKPGRQLIKKDVQIGAMGTGFIITPDGYIITNAHVVYAEEDYLKWQLTQTALKALIEKDVEDFIKEAGELNVEISEETMNIGIKNASLYYQQYMEMSKVETSIFTDMGIAIPGLQAMQRGFGSDLRKRGEPIPGKDVAILKIDKTNLPTVPLGDDTSIATGERIYAIGYPAVATFHPLLSEGSAIEPTMTSGLISARKTMQTGFDVFQTDASITHGNSGGPAFNEKGEVIGITTFGSIDYKTGQEIAGMNFLIPISVAKQFLNEINVKPQESRLSLLYKEGLDYYDKQQYKYALEKFREVNELNGGYPYVQKYISDSRTAINEGRDRSIPVLFYVGISAVALIVFLGVAGVIIILIIRSKAGGTKPKTPPTGTVPPFGVGSDIHPAGVAGK